MKNMNFAHKYSAPETKCKIESESEVMPNRVTKLQTLITRFVNGQPIGDQVRQLGYNTLEDNPLQKKGIDLADLPQLMRANRDDIVKIQEQIKREKAEKEKEIKQDLNQQLDENKVEI